MPRIELGPVMRRLLRAPAALYDRNMGWILGRRFLRLTHVGRRSGRRYRTVLEIVGTGPAPDELIVMAGLGRGADWYRNVHAQPAVEVATSGLRFRPARRDLDEVEGLGVLTEYNRRHRLVRPAVHWMLGRLVGCPYDGSEEWWRRVARDLPLVSFRPEDSE